MPITMGATRRKAAIYTQDNTDIHALNGIRTHYPSVRASEDSPCLRPLGYRDRQSLHYFLLKLQFNNEKYFTAKTLQQSDDSYSQISPTLPEAHVVLTRTSCNSSYVKNLGNKFQPCPVGLCVHHSDGSS
jgi:hypothetical protein